jgi:hypothetical protein
VASKCLCINFNLPVVTTVRFTIRKMSSLFILEDMEDTCMRKLIYSTIFKQRYNTSQIIIKKLY